MDACPAVLNHNVETVSHLYAEVRPQASYERSLELLVRASGMGDNTMTKSGFMVGLGETRDDVLGLLRDLQAAGVEAVTMGQYLAPTKQHAPVREYVPPETFEDYAVAAKEMGFRRVLSAPLVRSSYRAGDLVRARSAGAQ